MIQLAGPEVKYFSFMDFIGTKPSLQSRSQGNYIEDLITFDGYITGIAIRENGAQLAVALHNDQTADVFLVMRPLSGMSC